MNDIAISLPADDLASAIQDLVLDGFTPHFGELEGVFESHPVWRAAAERGSDLWLDTGDVEAAGALWSAEFSGLTTNNTLLNKEVQKGIYDDFVGEVAAVVRAQAPDADGGLLVREIAFALNARHGLTLVERFDAHVSVELHTDLANELEATCHYARRFFAISPMRFYVKVPLTPTGVLAARRLAREGILINFTLEFSARQNDLVARIAGPAFCNVFLGRLNSFVSQHGLGSGEQTGQLALKASWENVRALREAGVAPTRQIAASIRSAGQVWDLAGCDVLTIPVAAAQGVVEGGIPYDAAGRFDADFRADVNEEVAGMCSALWSIDDRHRAFVDALAAQDLDEMTPEGLLAFAAAHGAADLLPAWTAEDVAQVDADGKIPDFGVWRDRLAGGAVGLDAVFNLSGLRSFAADQRAMDDRIRSLLAR